VTQSSSGSPNIDCRYLPSGNPLRPRRSSTIALSSPKAEELLPVQAIVPGTSEVLLGPQPARPQVPAVGSPEGELLPQQPGEAFPRRLLAPALLTVAFVRPLVLFREPHPVRSVPEGAFAFRP
jgi:hypothetical protein